LTVVGRLAPTPSGALHLGNACAFAAAWLSVRSAGGRLLLRIEDVDVGRARADLTEGLRTDLAWLGLRWDHEVPPQSQRDYRPWLDRLAPHTYRCTCTRKQLSEAGGVYPGTCRDAGHSEGSVRLRLDPAIEAFTDRRWGPRAVDPLAFGDPTLRRRDGTFTYNLAVVADDLTDGVTEVVRGADLLDYTAVQLRLWRLFDAAPPTWLHSPLILGPDGKKLSKSHGSLEIAALRAAGVTPDAIWSLVLPWLGLPGEGGLEGALPAFQPDLGPLGPIRLDQTQLDRLRASPTSRRSPPPK
jgi:glutamyl/glutaminyl-tRNA synthetase